MPEQVQDPHREVCDRLTGIEQALTSIDEGSREQSKRLRYLEDKVDDHTAILYGSRTALDDNGGVVGMLRQLRTLQRITLSVLVPVVAAVIHNWVTGVS